MAKRTRLKKGQGSMKDRSRLTPVKNGSRHEAVEMMRNVPSSRVLKYAGMKKGAVESNPAMHMLKEEAVKEVGRRKMLLNAWKRGKPSPEEAKGKKPLLGHVKEWVQKGTHYLGRGVQEYMKVITGEKAKEMEEWIGSMGMSEAEKKKFHEARVQHEKESAEAEQREIAKISPMFAGVEETPEQAEAERKEIAKISPLVAGEPAPPEPEPVKRAPPEKPEPVAPAPPVREVKKDAKTVINIYTGEAERKPAPEPVEEVTEAKEPVDRDDDLGDVFDVVNEERAELQREMDRPFDPSQESMGDIIAEGRRDISSEREWLDEERGFKRVKKK